MFHNSGYKKLITRIIPFILLIIVVFSISNYIAARHISFPERINGEVNIEKEREYWEQRISKIGAEEANIEFSESMKGLSANQQHSGAHSFGGALYDMGGDVFSICDSQFAYGCLHEFVTDSVIEEGFESIAVLNQGCLEKPGRESGFCQHGIGHGIAAILGYELKDLKKALVFCYENLPNGELSGCYGGVFMEYNLRTVLSGDVENRPVLDNTIDPCDKLGERFQPACAFWATQWWLQAIYKGEATEDTFSGMGNNCRAIDINQDVRDACFAGVGNFSGIESDFNLTRAKELCAAATMSDRESLFCSSYMKKRIKAEKDLHGAQPRCDTLEGEVLRSCLNWKGASSDK